ncbi:MarR family winged helix-turn-helix transcriptional regulator [Metabacillus iocasae]|uniref:HTH-type transcriptional regulator SarZ n=1 Tax=Priestia iocasae TaxID=2291674 RepID=A0ABS2QXF3_9BACI|nr:MarR family transcriptional regulator [Metabacillus iocasae]MBM7703687.1 DNA-binding MarR family transcriptional regulator [Metabacillus iocasae]
MSDRYEQLKLEHQLCFTIYATSREITKVYKPLLDELNVTYPQYLALLVLWEEEEVSVKQMGERLYLDSGTLTPMLKRMEQQGLLTRQRSLEDERVVTVRLTEEGKQLKDKACHIPDAVFSMSNQSPQQLSHLKQTLNDLLAALHTYNSAK